MDAKSLDSRSLNFSGTTLSVLLAAALSLVALLCDYQANRAFNLSFSLTLPFWVCAAATAGLGYWVVPLLRSLKAGQVIREDGPQTHLKKGGTPTMGGVFFIPVGVLLALLWSGLALNLSNFAPVLPVSLLTLGYGFIGWLDDWQILRRKSNKGISPQMKLALQIGFAVLFCLWLIFSQPANISTIDLPFGLALPLGLLFWPLAAFALVAESNATNLTDGVDGLAGGLCAIALLGLGAIIAPTYPGLTIFCACISGSCLGFLVHNRNPATVFMGDTGSLALGGALASVAILSNTLWSLFIISGIFFVETLSVMAQVSYYKATKGPDGVGKRLFKMAPLHHHLELSGWSEIQVVATFYAINAILALLCFFIR
ncbi:phospho-N-acetylmuramoyl-pentapeptide-transferase [Aerosakkonema funiforme]|uniref:Phospho-N-acetylmuramoyl-pentapeptide-transferase n=2 Tax=Oscillatoriophycideae TaxID=1301283 RepID=A0A926ZH23_9CYAN|nr:phospho-N-acetylmuramoyl-pentapeptide-transferase [Aerosakkonema funiforme]MBD2181717.1 phospho-N-acetylmuramoyl-pentapeptide-transferase [Aerosakkonema funiforme FACHB-1375]